MVNEYICLQHVILCQNLKSYVFASVCGELKYHKDTLKILKVLCQCNILKLVGLKSHDCHVLMQDLLPIFIRGILPKNVRQVITRL